MQDLDLGEVEWHTGTTNVPVLEPQPFDSVIKFAKKQHWDNFDVTGLGLHDYSLMYMYDKIKKVKDTKDTWQTILKGEDNKEIGAMAGHQMKRMWYRQDGTWLCRTATGFENQPVHNVELCIQRVIKSYHQACGKVSLGKAATAVCAKGVVSKNVMDAVGVCCHTDNLLLQFQGQPFHACFKNGIYDVRSGAKVKDGLGDFYCCNGIEYDEGVCDSKHKHHKIYKKVQRAMLGVPGHPEDADDVLKKKITGGIMLVIGASASRAGGLNFKENVVGLIGMASAKKTVITGVCECLLTCITCY